MMEENTRKLPVRFNLDKPDQKRAWEYLQTMDRDIFTSWNHVIHLALLDYFDRYYKVQEDPYLETREREERFIQQIVDGVCESLKQTLPLFLSCSLHALLHPSHCKLKLLRLRRRLRLTQKVLTGDSSAHDIPCL